MTYITSVVGGVNLPEQYISTNGCVEVTNLHIDINFNHSLFLEVLNKRKKSLSKYLMIFKSEKKTFVESVFYRNIDKKKTSNISES